MASTIVTQAMLATAEKGLNKLLQLDPLAFEQLAALAGKVIAIHSTVPAYTLFIIITEQGLSLHSENDVSPNSSISSTTPVLLQWLFSQQKLNFSADPRIILEGETDVVWAFSKLLDNLSPDWQYQLSEWFGPAPASFMIASAKMGSEQLQMGFSFFQQQIGNLVNQFSPDTIGKQAKPQQAFSDLLSLLQKKFGQS